ncbi:MAG TPA: succinate dehydrogenase assembly factor 2 [Casimicrobiaceae bacterium]|jgi:antitoxin CptB
MDDRRLARIRWRCRRGLLENDLILTRFLDAKGAALTEEEIAMLDTLLALTDNDLWDLIAGRREPDASVRPLVDELRHA